MRFPERMLMPVPDFTLYSLALYRGEKRIHSATAGGLRPLFEALAQHRGLTGLTLHDRVTGLAAARLAVLSGAIIHIVTGVASAPAVEFLDRHGILLTAGAEVDRILTRDKSAVCPGERIALETEDPSVFVQQIRQMLGLPEVS
jgi:hypothetical protein